MTRTVLLRGVAIVISIAMLGWIVADARWQGVGERLARIDLGALVGVALLFAASYAMRGARIAGEFRDEIVDDDGPLRRYLRILRVTLVHNALVNVLPFRSGEAAFPVLLSRGFGIGVGRAIVSLLWLRAQDATVVLGLAALFWPGLPIAGRLPAIAVIVVAASAVPWWARRHRRPVATAVGNGSRLDRLHALLERSTRRNASGWLWTLGNWTVKLIAEAWLLSVVVDAHDSGVPLLGAIGAELASILPIQGVAGFGTFEAGAAALMRTRDLPLQAGLEAALVLHAVVLALALAAGAFAAIVLPGSHPD